MGTQTHPMSRSPRRSRSRSPSTKRDVRGTVLRVNDRGFGFLELETGEIDIFFHTSDIVDRIDIRQLRSGDKVEVDLKRSYKIPDKFEACNVRPLDPEVKDRRKSSPVRRRSPSYDRRRRSPSYDRRRRRSYSRGRG